MKVMTFDSTAHGPRHFWVEATPVIDLMTGSGYRYRAFRRKNGDHLGVLEIDGRLYLGTGAAPQDCFQNALVQFREWKIQPDIDAVKIETEMKANIEAANAVVYPKGKLYE